ncbi:MAG TPA: hypothetical protein VM243_11040 [Phycisphaerae bacterium]|nr:hypothetical protein [Phycisphaerae bacterium]
MSWASVGRRMAHVAAILLVALILGTACHEVLGHGLTGVLVGGRIGYVEILGVQVWPELGWHGWPDTYGLCAVTDVPDGTAGAVMRLAGSMSTWLVSVLAVALLWLRRWRGWPRFVLVCLSIWWIDLLTYTLPSWGLRRSILWGPVYSEPYEAAIALGVRGWAFQAFAIGTSALLATATWMAIRHGRQVGHPGDVDDGGAGGID